MVNDVVLRCLFVFAWLVSKTWKFHIPRVGMEYSNVQITASTLAQVHSEKSNRVVGDVWPSRKKLQHPTRCAVIPVGCRMASESVVVWCASVAHVEGTGNGSRAHREDADTCTRQPWSLVIPGLASWVQ